MAKEDTRETLKLREAVCFIFYFLETVQMKRMAPREIEIRGRCGKI